MASITLDTHGALRRSFCRAAILLLAFCSFDSLALSEIYSPDSPRFTVIPPAPVVEGAVIELRLAVRHTGESAVDASLNYYLDSVSADSRIGCESITLAPGEQKMVSTWYEVAVPAGEYNLLYVLKTSTGEHRGQWPLAVRQRAGRAVPVLQGMWIEPGAITMCAADAAPKTLNQVINDSIDAIAELGVRVLIVAYVEYNGIFYYPSKLQFFDHDVQRMSTGGTCAFDFVETILSQADLHGMHVFLGLGRSGDTRLLWEFDDPAWSERNDKALTTARNVAEELHTRYSNHPSLFGWYLTHEMNDLKRAGAYYNPLALYCKSLAPEKPVLVAPAGTPIVTHSLLASSAVDIFAYQDAVGAGYVPYKNTFQPNKRIATLDGIFAKYRALHKDTGKHLWADLEIWEMDGTHNYGGAYPAAFERVKRQIEIESRHAGMLTGYSYHGYLQAPNAGSEKPDAQARKLFEEYAAYLEEQKPFESRSNVLGQNAAQTSENLP